MICRESMVWLEVTPAVRVVQDSLHTLTTHSISPEGRCNERLVFGDLLILCSFRERPIVQLPHNVFCVDLGLSPVELLELVEALSEVHLVLARRRPLLQQLHRVVFQLLLCSFQGLKIPGCPCFKNIVTTFRISSKADLGHAGRALDVEPIYSQAKIVHVVHVLFSGVELSSLVDVFPTGSTAHVTGSHHTDNER